MFNDDHVNGANYTLNANWTKVDDGPQTVARVRITNAYSGDFCASVLPASDSSYLGSGEDAVLTK